MIDISQYGKESQNLYYEIDDILENNKISLKIDNKKAWGGTFYKLPNGDYEILISQNSQNDFVLTHELLHIYSCINQIRPSMVYFNKINNNVCEPLGMMFNSLLEHNYIYERQVELGIGGYNEFIDECFIKLTNAQNTVSKNIDKNFKLIISIITFLNDLETKCLSAPREHYHLGIKEKYQDIYSVANELYELYKKRKGDIPFYIRKAIINIINKYISLFNTDLTFIKYKMDVFVSITERQLDMPASTVLSLGVCDDGKVYFASKHDNQSVSASRLNFELSKVDGYKKGLDNISLGEILEKYRISHFIDDRCGKWNFVSYYE